MTSHRICYSRQAHAFDRMAWKDKISNAIFTVTTAPPPRRRRQAGRPPPPPPTVAKKKKKKAGRQQAGRPH